ncbi:hypothetical protein V8E54_012668 [Elaphomyces granulatus]
MASTIASSSKYATISATHSCWACGINDEYILNFCHIIPKSLPQRFEMYQSMGYLPSDIRPAHPDNYIILCANCHNAFDCVMPTIVILPTNIEFFINYEERDYELRTEGEEPQPRSFPTAKMREESAMIVKASLGAFTPFMTPGIDPIPRGTRDQVSKLIELWERFPPTPAKNEGAKKKGKGRATKRRSSDSPESQEHPRKRHEAESVKGTTRKSTTSKGKKPAKVVEKPEIMFPNLKPRQSSSFGLDGAWDYCLGPNMSANDVIAKYTGYRNS